MHIIQCGCCCCCYYCCPPYVAWHVWMLHQHHARKTDQTNNNVCLFVWVLPISEPQICECVCNMPTDWNKNHIICQTYIGNAEHMTTLEYVHLLCVSATHSATFNEVKFIHVCLSLKSRSHTQLIFAQVPLTLPPHCFGSFRSFSHSVIYVLWI